MKRPGQLSWQDSVGEVAQLYGPRGVETYTQTFAGRTDLKPEDALRLFRQQPTQMSTRFFREANLRVLATRVAERLMRQLGISSLEIGDQAASSGKEARSLAAMLKAEGVPFHISAFDVSPLAVQIAKQGEYIDEPLAAIAQHIGATAAERYVYPYFEEAEGVVRTTSLEAHLDFDRHDLFDGPPPGRPRHVQVIENVLWHVPQSTGARDQMLGNVLGNLAEGGVLVFEGVNGNSRQGENYARWVAGLAENHGLHPMDGLGGQWSQQIRQYVPQD